MFVKAVTRPGPEIYGGFCPKALVLPDSFGIGAGGGICWLGRAGSLSLFTFFIHFIRYIMKQKTAWLLAPALTTPILGIIVGRAVAARRLREDVQRLFAAAANAHAQTYHEIQLAGLPAPVQRYFRHVLSEGQPYLRGLRLRHGGQFKTDLKKDWMAIEGEQYIAAEPPGFIWQGTTRWFRVRDEYVAGRAASRCVCSERCPSCGGRGRTTTRVNYCAGWPKAPGCPPTCCQAGA